MSRPLPFWAGRFASINGPLSLLPDDEAPTGIRSRYYQVAELLLRYPAEALPTPNTLLAETPALETVAKWLPCPGKGVSAVELRNCF